MNLTGDDNGKPAVKILCSVGEVKAPVDTWTSFYM